VHEVCVETAALSKREERAGVGDEICYVVIRGGGGHLGFFEDITGSGDVHRGERNNSE